MRDGERAEHHVDAGGSILLEGQTVVLFLEPIDSAQPRRDFYFDMARDLACVPNIQVRGGFGALGGRREDVVVVSDFWILLCSSLHRHNDLWLKNFEIP